MNEYYTQELFEETLQTVKWHRINHLQSVPSIRADQMLHASKRIQSHETVNENNVQRRLYFGQYRVASECPYADDDLRV